MEEFVIDGLPKTTSSELLKYLEEAARLEGIAYSIYREEKFSGKEPPYAARREIAFAIYGHVPNFLAFDSKPNSITRLYEEKEYKKIVFSGNNFDGMEKFGRVLKWLLG